MDFAMGEHDLLQLPTHASKDARVPSNDGPFMSPLVIPSHGMMFEQPGVESADSPTAHMHSMATAAAGVPDQSAVQNAAFGRSLSGPPAMPSFHSYMLLQQQQLQLQQQQLHFQHMQALDPKALKVADLAHFTPEHAYLQAQQIHDQQLMYADALRLHTLAETAALSGGSSRSSTRPNTPQASDSSGHWTSEGHSSPGHISPMVVSRTRMNSVSAGSQKSPLRAGFTPQSPVPAGPSSPLPYECDLNRMRVAGEDDGSPVSGHVSPRRGSGEAEDTPAVRRVRAASGICRTSSLPAMTKRPSTTASSPRSSSPRLARRVVPTLRLGDLARPHSPSVDAASLGAEGVIVMDVEPAQFGRFRYEAEGRQNSLEGEKGGFPAVRVSPEWAGLIPDGTPINVTLIRRHDFKPHHHVLMSKDSTDIRQFLRNGRATFPNLVVKRQRSALRYPPEDQRAVRLLFTMTFVKDGTLTEAFCVSKPIFNSDLKISGCSHRSGPANDWTDAILLCSKVQKKSIAIRIAENTETDFVPPPDAEGWQQAPDGSFVCVFRAGFEVHHQYAIAFRMPPFHDQSISVSREVYFQLIDVDDETSSNFETFTYISTHYDTNV